MLKIMLLKKSNRNRKSHNILLTKRGVYITVCTVGCNIMKVYLCKKGRVKDQKVNKCYF